ncbi:MAG: UDP-N-acetylmuramate dehydrogenase [Actinomycetota bacterium]
MTPDLPLAERILGEGYGDRVRRSFPMAPLTTFRIGGPAALYVEPEDERDLQVAGRAVTEAGIPFVVLGKGSNVLVADRGFEGLVIRLGRGFRWAGREGHRIAAGASMPLPALAGIALQHGLAGLEFGVAIPASLGGAVRMNAGAHGGDMADVVEQVEVFRLDGGGRATVPAADLGYRYRRSVLPPSAVVVGATVALTPAATDAIRERMDDARAWRRRTQPLAEPNCGSVFKNPTGAHAARLIDDAGLKGMRVGGVQVSEKHANFIVATPGAQARDVVRLIHMIQERVHERSGVDLEPEVQILGEVHDAA